MPPFLSTSHCEFYGTYSCAHAQRTILSRLIPSLLENYVVPSLFVESIT